ncbi:MAG TPA: hypothetical protein DCL44_11970 [Elusimicrobia bacterium]|nr:hypothetical protein [Elusimicrobiota bacterium]
MKKYLFLIAVLFCAGGLGAKPGTEAAPGPQKGQEKQNSVSTKAVVASYTLHSQSERGRIIVAQVPSAPDAAKKTQPPATPSRKEAAKAADQDSEEAGVLIDSKSEDTESETQPASYKAATERQDESAFASYLPASYGQLKGILDEQGRNVLVFENEDGVLSFVQVSVGKQSVVWKLLTRIGRSQE